MANASNRGKDNLKPMQHANKERLCPSCSKGKCERHSYDYLDKNWKVKLCRCPSCKGKAKTGNDWAFPSGK